MSLGEERTTYVVQQSAQPVEVQLVRGVRGYRWIINVKAEKADSALQLLQYIDGELRRRFGGEKIAEAAPVQQAQASQPAHPVITADDVRNAIPSDLQGLVSVEETDAFVRVVPKQFLGSDAFGRISDAIRKLGGEYVSRGKESHWLIVR